MASPNLGAWIGLPTMTEDFEDIAARYEAQDPAAHLPANTHPYVVAGYADFQKLHASLLRSKNANFLWLPIGGGPGGIVMSMHVVSHGTINIDPADPHAEPIVDYRALSNPTDMEIMVENVRYMRQFMASEALADAAPVETNPGLDVEGEELEAWIRSVLIPTNFHPVATAAKKPREKGGVVDEELLVHGVKGLRVVDGSIMPLLPGANTQQPVYMLAEKVSFSGRFGVAYVSGVAANDAFRLLTSSRRRMPVGRRRLGMRRCPKRVRVRVRVRVRAKAETEMRKRMMRRKMVMRAKMRMRMKESRSEARCTCDQASVKADRYLSSPVSNVHTSDIIASRSNRSGLPQRGESGAVKN